MQKIKLELDNLAVETFETAQTDDVRGTVQGHDPSRGGHGQPCGSAFDACHTGLCTGDCQPTFSPEACPTSFPEYC